jgi:transposase-like protein
MENNIQLPKDVIRNLIASEEFKNTGDILSCLKDMFKQVLQEVMEVELDEKLGYDKHERNGTEIPENYRNGYSKKTVKSQIGEVDIKIPRDRNGEFEPKILPKHKRNADGLDEKILNLYAA